MKILVKIGYMSVLLPDEKGVSKLLEILSRGVEVEDRLYEDKLVLRERSLRLEFKTVPESSRVVQERDGAEEPMVDIAPPKRLNGRRPLLLRGRTP